MENRDRDKLNRNSNESTNAGSVNRETSQRQGNMKDDSSAEFGQKIGRSENLNEPNRRDEGVGSEGMNSNTGRSSGSMGGNKSSELGNEELNRNSSRERGSNIDRDRSSESEH